MAELDALDDCVFPPPQALSIRLAARMIGSPAISLICMGIFLFVATVVAEPSAGPLQEVLHQELSLRRDWIVASHGIFGTTWNPAIRSVSARRR